jgi:cytochrome c556
MRRTALLGLSAALLSTAALAATIGVKEEMKDVVDAASNTLFAVGGDVDPANGPDAAKVPAARWAEGLKAAETLKAVGVHLQGPQKKPGPEWTSSAADFAKYAAAAEKAAQTKDGAGFSTAANALGDTCTACHTKWKPKT